MAGEIKYQVKIGDKVIDDRKSARTYTHAVVAWNDVDAEIANAERPAAAHEDEYSLKNYKWHAKRSAYTAGVPVTVQVTDCYKPWSYEETLTQDEIDAEKAKIAGGYEGYLSRKRDAAIQTAKAISREPYLCGYCGRADLASKLAAKISQQRYVAKVEIVPVEVVGIVAAKKKAA